MKHSDVRSSTCVRTWKNFPEKFYNHVEAIDRKVCTKCGYLRNNKYTESPINEPPNNTEPNTMRTSCNVVRWCLFDLLVTVYTLSYVVGSVSIVTSVDSEAVEVDFPEDWLPDDWALLDPIIGDADDPNVPEDWSDVDVPEDCEEEVVRDVP